MFALAGLYANWHYLFSWSNNPTLNEEQLKEELCTNLELVTNEGDITLYGDKRIELDGSVDGGIMEDKYILAIDDEREKATLTNRAGRLLFEYTERLNFEQNAVPEELKGMFEKKNIALNHYEWAHEERTIYDKERGFRYYIHVKADGTSMVYEEKTYNLKVKRVEERNTLKIYKKKREAF